MHVIEFEADIQDGAIKLPRQYRELESKHVKVIAWVEESAATEPAATPHKAQTAFFADGYIQQHWRELIITTSAHPQEDDDRVLEEEYGAYLSAA
ncbi:MAG: hypothetical protein EOM24_37725 [Chloroflexia bacterium]|nr:hypothetical protein [Chloroflexia bacterium]